MTEGCGWARTRSELESREVGEHRSTLPENGHPGNPAGIAPGDGFDGA